jgi:hypothetical protein
MSFSENPFYIKSTPSLVPVLGFEVPNSERSSHNVGRSDNFKTMRSYLFEGQVGDDIGPKRVF